MIFTKEGLRHLAVTIGISMFIYLAATLLLGEDDITWLTAAKSVLLGSIIWIVSEAAFGITLKLWPHSIVPGYVALFIIIAVGTSLGLYLFEIVDSKLYIVVCIFAEIGGFLIAVTERIRYKKSLNAKLEDFKKKN